VRIDVFSIFPELVDSFASASLLGRAREHGLLDLRTWDLRSETTDAHRSVDDAPFGGGAGMVMKPGPLFACVDEKAIVNACAGLLATGGSTNHALHIPAMALAAGLIVDWNDFSVRLSLYEPDAERAHKRRNGRASERARLPSVEALLAAPTT